MNTNSLAMKMNTKMIMNIDSDIINQKRYDCGHYIRYLFTAPSEPIRAVAVFYHQSQILIKNI